MDDFLDAPGDAMTFDNDGDGFAETVVLDRDGDGLADAALVEDIATGDRIAYVDTDADGDIDSKVIDIGGDGVVDDVVIDDADEDDDDVAADVTVTDPFAVAPAVEAVEDDSVHGDPIEDKQYHQAQPGPVDCVPTSIAMIVSEITGSAVPATDVVARAHELGVIGDSGMVPSDGVRLLEDLGVEADLRSGSLDDLRAALDNEQEVIIGVDAADLYAGGGGPSDPGLQTGHAVVITGIDDAAGLVYINDPGFPDGAGISFSVSEFEDAWADSGNAMIVATESGIEDDSGSSLLALILLPFVLLLGRNP